MTRAAARTIAGSRCFPKDVELPDVKVDAVGEPERRRGVVQRLDPSPLRAERMRVRALTCCCRPRLPARLAFVEPTTRTEGRPAFRRQRVGLNALVAHRLPCPCCCAIQGRASVRSAVRAEAGHFEDRSVAVNDSISRYRTSDDADADERAVLGHDSETEPMADGGSVVAMKVCDVCVRFGQFQGHNAESRLGIISRRIATIGSAHSRPMVRHAVASLDAGRSPYTST